MATPKSQRIGIWIIAIVMLVGTLGSFAVMVLANSNASNDQQQAQAQAAAQQQAVAQQAAALSKQYYPLFQSYQSAPAAFDASSVGSKVTTSDLKQGTGAAIAATTTYQAYYIGWNPKGVVFDSSFNGSALKAPFDTSSGQPISGWQQGIVGMKVGGIRELTIPAALAYGSTGSGANIPPNTPIKFIVMVIATD
jgi:FKBP-type peptidyl-prolyl cis-trans isomerase FkpA